MSSPSARGCFQIDQPFEPSGQNHRQVGRLLALEDPTGVYARHAIGIHNPRSVAHQATHLDELPSSVDRRHPVLSRERDQGLGQGIEKRVNADQQRPHIGLGEGRKSRCQVIIATRIHDMDRHAGPPCERLHVLHLELRSSPTRIDEKADDPGRGHDLP